MFCCPCGVWKCWFGCDFMLCFWWELVECVFAVWLFDCAEVFIVVGLLVFVLLYCGWMIFGLCILPKLVSCLFAFLECCLGVFLLVFGVLACVTVLRVLVVIV